MKPTLTMLVAIVLTSAAFSEETKTFPFKKTKEGELSIKAFLPQDWKADQKRPAIVFFFGGGWTNGTPTQFEPQAKHLAARGMVAFCADYRVKSRHGVRPDACVEDAKSAIRWVRQNAAKLGVDPDRMVGAGGSAGGHIAACTGICPGLDAADEDHTISSKPNVLVLFNPVLNFNVPMLTDRLGKDEKLAKAISPTRHLAKDSPPTLILFGSDDRLLAHGKEFMERSKQLGHHAELFLADRAGHGFFNRPPWLEKTTKRMDEFLVSLDYLEADKAPPRTLEHFKSKLDRSFTPDKAVAVFGEADQNVGSGLIIYEYLLDDGSKIWLGFPGFEKILYAKHKQKDGAVEELLPK